MGISQTTFAQRCFKRYGPHYRGSVLALQAFGRPASTPIYRMDRVFQESMRPEDRDRKPVNDPLVRLRLPD